MKYSFSEAHHKKTVSIVEIDGSGASRAEYVPLIARRDVRVITGLLADVLKGPTNGESEDDYIHVTLKDHGALLDPMSRIREIYPNALSLKNELMDAVIRLDGARVDHTRLSDVELFGAFFDQVTGDPMTAEQASEFVSVVEVLRQQEREVVA